MSNNIIDIIAFIILPIIGSLFIIYACFEFMAKVERNIYKPKIYYIIAYIAIVLMSTFTGSLGKPVVNAIVLVLGLMIVGHFLFNDSKVYLLYYCVFGICLLFLDLLIVMGMGVITTIFNIYFVSPAYFQITTIICMRLIEYTYVKLFIYFLNKRSSTKVTNSQWFKFLVLPMFSLVFIFTLIMNLQIYAGIEEIIWLLINIILVLVLNVYVTHMFDAILKNNILKNEINLYHQQTSLQYQYYDNLENKYQESRKLIHDIRNHLHAIEELYNTDDIHTGKYYTDDIHKMLNELNQKYYTSSKVLNIILNDKFQKVKNTSIKLDYRIGDINIDFIKDIDITTIFANLLDNAIESSIEVKENSYIKLDVDKFNGFIVVNITNSMSKKPIKKGKKFKSNKKNHEGIGLENVKRSLANYEGSMVIEYTDDEFKVNIVIPI